MSLRPWRNVTSTVPPEDNVRPLQTLDHFEREALVARNEVLFYNIEMEKSRAEQDKKNAEFVEVQQEIASKREASIARFDAARQKIFDRIKRIDITREGLLNANDRTSTAEVVQREG